MPINMACPVPNPLGYAIAAPPDARRAEKLTAGQGDHVFGDLITMIRASLETVLGSARDFDARFEAFDRAGGTRARTHWQQLSVLDLGHNGREEPLVFRDRDVAEWDEHSYVFGVYTARFQWQFCEVVCTRAGEDPTVESRQVGVLGGDSEWRRQVMARFDETTEFLVDHTALRAWLKDHKALRRAGDEKERHPVISLAAARALATSQTFAAGRIRRVFDACQGARLELEQMLPHLDTPSRRWQPGYMDAGRQVPDQWVVVE